MVKPHASKQLGGGSSRSMHATAAFWNGSSSNWYVRAGTRFAKPTRPAHARSSPEHQWASVASRRMHEHTLASLENLIASLEAQDDKFEEAELLQVGLRAEQHPHQPQVTDQLMVDQLGRAAPLHHGVRLLQLQQPRKQRGSGQVGQAARGAPANERPEQLEELLRTGCLRPRRGQRCRGSTS